MTGRYIWYGRLKKPSEFYDKNPNSSFDNVKEELKNAKPELLEPIMSVEAVTPEEYMGDIVADLNKRRGQMAGMDDRLGAKVIKADVPLSEMFGYVTTLRTLSSGRATSTMEFSHYATTPRNIADEVIKKVKGQVEA